MAKQLTAESNSEPHDVATVASAIRKLWIVTSAADLVFFIGTPLLFLPLLALSGTGAVHFQDFVVVIAGFGVIGHHFPGLLRAYGDTELFRRFRVRFIVAPILLFSVSMFLSHRDLLALSVIIMVWGTWHFFMQVYGFARIYDAKVKSFAAATVKLDFLMCMSWFVAGALYSTGRLSELLFVFYNCGGPLIEPSLVHGLRLAWMIGTLAITVVFLCNHFSRVFRDEPTNPVKLLILFSSIATWWFTMATVSNVIIGVALFEIFHDIQYLAIVWIYNRGRVESKQPTGKFTSFLFRRSGTMIGLYLGLVCAYGYTGFFGIQDNPDSFWFNTLYAFLATSSLLHYYYDGFIWKVREKQTRRGLGLAGGSDEIAVRSDAINRYVTHGFRWCLFVVPVVYLAVAQSATTIPDEDSLYRINKERLTNIVAIVPDSAQYRFELGSLLLTSPGNTDTAIGHFLSVLELQPDDADTNAQLGLAYLNQRKFDKAIKSYRASLRVVSDDSAAQRLNRSASHANLAIALDRSGQPDEAIESLERAFQLNSRDTNIAIQLKSALRVHAWNLATHSDASRRKPTESLRLAQRALQLFGPEPRILDALATAHAANDQFDLAVTHAESAVEQSSESDPEFAQDVRDRLQLYRQKRAFLRPKPTGG